MRTLRLTIAVLLMSVSIIEAHKLKDFPDELQISIWENRFFKSTPETIFPLLNEMLHLPEKPWPPRLKKLLLNIHRKYFEGDKERDLPGTSMCRDELGYVNEMALWQKGDVDFLPVLLENIGGKTTFAIADFGEPAFKPILKYLYKDGFPGAQLEGVRALNRMFEKDFAFLKEEHNRQLAQAGLAHVLKFHYKGWEFMHTETVNTLQHIPNREVEMLLISVSQNNTYHQEVRERATFILGLFKTPTIRP